jgi:hypothetical protein
MFVIPPVETGGYSYWSPPDFLNLNNIAPKGRCYDARQQGVAGKVRMDFWIYEMGFL